MEKARNRFEITRNRSTNSIRQNLMCSSNILKNSAYLLKQETLEANSSVNNDATGFIHSKGLLGKAGDIIGPMGIEAAPASINHITQHRYPNQGNGNIGYEETERSKNTIVDMHTDREQHVKNNVENEIKQEFERGILYDKIIMQQQNYKTAADNIHQNFRDNNLTNVVNSIKFEENINTKIPEIFKHPPVDILFPDFRNLRDKGKTQEESNRIDTFIPNNKNTKKEITDYLKHDFLSNTLVRNKMYDYFDLEKKNYIQIENVNTLNNYLENSQLKNTQNIVLSAYKNVHTINTLDHRETEANVLNVLKQQRMPIIDKKDQENDIMSIVSREKANRNKINDINIKQREIGNNAEFDAKKNENKFTAAFINISNQKASIKNYDLKKNEEIKKKKKNIFMKQMKNSKDAEVQTEEKDLEKLQTNIIDSEVEKVVKALDKATTRGKQKKMKDEKLLKGKQERKSAAEPEKELDNETKASSTNDNFKLAYINSKPFDREKTDSDTESDSGSDTESKKDQSGTSTDEEIRKQTEEKQKQILYYVNCLQYGFPHTFLNMVGKNNSYPFSSPINNNPNNNIGGAYNTQNDTTNEKTNELLRYQFLQTYRQNLLKLLHSKKYKDKLPEHFKQTASLMVSNLTSSPLSKQGVILPPSTAIPQNAQPSTIHLSSQQMQTQFNTTNAHTGNQVNPFSFPPTFNMVPLSAAKKHVTNNVDDGEEGDNEESYSEEESSREEESSSDTEKEQLTNNKQEDITDILLQRFYSNKQKEECEQQKFKEKLWNFLGNNDMLKQRSRGKFNTLRNKYYDYKFHDKENAEFLRRFREWEEQFDKKILNRKKKKKYELNNRKQINENNPIGTQKKNKVKWGVKEKAHLLHSINNQNKNVIGKRAFSQPLGPSMKKKNKQLFIEEINDSQYTQKEKVKTHKLSSSKTQKEISHSSTPHNYKIVLNSGSTGDTGTKDSFSRNRGLGMKHGHSDIISHKQMSKGNIKDTYNKLPSKIQEKKKIKKIQKADNSLRKKTLYDMINEEYYTNKNRSLSYKNRAATLNTLMQETAPIIEKFQTQQNKAPYQQGRDDHFVAEGNHSNDETKKQLLNLKQFQTLKSENKHNKSNTKLKQKKSNSERNYENESECTQISKSEEHESDEIKRLSKQSYIPLEKKLERKINSKTEVNVAYNLKNSFKEKTNMYKIKRNIDNGGAALSYLLGKRTQNIQRKKKRNIEENEEEEGDDDDDDDDDDEEEEEEEEEEEKMSSNYDDTVDYDDYDSNDNENNDITEDENVTDDSFKSFDHFFDRRMIKSRFEKDTILGNVKREDDSFRDQQLMGSSNEIEETNSTEEQKKINIKTVRHEEKQRNNTTKDPVEGKVKKKTKKNTETEMENESEGYEKNASAQNVNAPIRIKFNLKQIKAGKIHNFINNDNTKKGSFDEIPHTNANTIFKNEVIHNTVQNRVNTTENIQDFIKNKRETPFSLNIKKENQNNVFEAYRADELVEKKSNENKIVKTHNFLKKHHGCGGGNYLKIKQDKCEKRTKNITLQRRAITGEIQKENDKLNTNSLNAKNEMTNEINTNNTNINTDAKKKLLLNTIPDPPIFFNNIVDGDDAKYNNFKLEHVDPNKWMQDVFGDDI